MQRDVVYRTFSVTEMITSLLLRSICVILIIVSLMHFEENPLGVSIIVILALIGLLFLGFDELTIRGQVLIQTNSSIISLIYKSEKVYDLTLVREANYSTTSPSTSEIGLLLILSQLFQIRTSKLIEPIILQMVDGSEYTLFTSLSPVQKKDIVHAMNNSINKLR